MGILDQLGSFGGAGPLTNQAALIDMMTGAGQQQALSQFSLKETDPFSSTSPERDPYRRMLQESYQPGFDVTKMPGFGGAMSAANFSAETAKRQAAATGSFYGGELPGILANVYAQNLLPQFNQYQAGLQQLSGANFGPDPGAALEALALSMQAENQRLGNLLAAMQLQMGQRGSSGGGGGGGGIQSSFFGGGGSSGSQGGVIRNGYNLRIPAPGQSYYDVNRSIPNRTMSRMLNRFV